MSENSKISWTDAAAAGTMAGGGSAAMHTLNLKAAATTLEPKDRTGRAPDCEHHEVKHEVKHA